MGKVCPKVVLITAGDIYQQQMNTGRTWKLIQNHGPEMSEPERESPYNQN